MQVFDDQSFDADFRDMAPEQKRNAVQYIGKCLKGINSFAGWDLQAEGRNHP